MSDNWHFDASRFEPCSILQRMYDDANEKYFKYQLPGVHVGYYHDSKFKTNEYACAVKLDKAKFVEYVLMNPLFRDWPQVLKQCILHEAVHVKHNNKHGHGPRFQKEKRRLILAGAFDDTL